MLLGGGTTKETKKNKRQRKMLGGGTTKGTKKNKRQRKMLGGGTTKKQSKVDGVRVLRALARSVTKAPKLKKT
jgi:hypothetical protein